MSAQTAQNFKVVNLIRLSQRFVTFHWRDLWTSQRVFTASRSKTSLHPNFGPLHIRLRPTETLLRTTRKNNGIRTLKQSEHKHRRDKLSLVSTIFHVQNPTPSRLRRIQRNTLLAATNMSFNAQAGHNARGSLSSSPYSRHARSLRDIAAQPTRGESSVRANL